MVFIGPLKKRQPLKKQTSFPRGNGILKPREFMGAVNREWSRADRYDLFFCIVVFDVTGPQYRGATGRDPLLQTLLDRIRPSDEIGIIDENRIAILCTDTSPEGAEKLCADIGGKLPANLVLPDHTIYGYSPTRTSKTDRTCTTIDVCPWAESDIAANPKPMAGERRGAEEKRSPGNEAPLFTCLDKVGGV